MGATNCPETPRQRMISMMYLVLTALLALNVSAEIINAFVLFDEAITSSTVIVVEKNDAIHNSFQAAWEENKTKTEVWKNKADELKEKADELCDYMDKLKADIITTGGGVNDGADPIAAAGIKKKDDQNVGSQIMISDAGPKEGKKLKQKFDEFRTYLIEEAKGNQTLITNFENSLSTEGRKNKEGEMVEWERLYFYSMPLVACITSLSKLQSDIRNAEADLLTYLYGQIDAGSLKFNKLDGKVFAKSNYVMSGDQFEADIFLAAFDTTKNPDIYIGKYDSVKINDPAIVEPKDIMIGEEGKEGGYYKLDSVVNGIGKYKITPGIGFGSVEGVIFFETGKGDNKKTLKYPFTNEYQVAAGSVTISPTKMNVFYIGVDNPVSVSAPGVAADKTFPSISGGGGSIRKSGKDWVVRVKTPTKNCRINVSGEINGNRKSLGGMDFRVKRVPDPVAKVAGRKGGNIPKTTLAAQSSVVADLENFDFDIRFNVVKFSVSANIGGFEQTANCSGSRFTPQAKNIIKKVKRGGKVYIEDVKAKGPDGTVRNLGSIAFKLQ